MLWSRNCPALDLGLAQQCGRGELHQLTADLQPSAAPVLVSVRRWPDLVNQSRPRNHNWLGSSVRPAERCTRSEAELGVVLRCFRNIISLGLPPTDDGKV